MDLTAIYYQRFLNFFVNHYKEDIKDAKAGHCMKITGFAMNELRSLIALIKPINPDLRVYILSEEETGDIFIHATKLIEFRNDNEKSLLVLIPSGSRTSAEDSYGDATFKDLSAAETLNLFFLHLCEEIPETQRANWDKVYSFISQIDFPVSRVINYLLFLDASSWTVNAWGEGLNCVGLLPDSRLIEDISNMQRRFLYNVRCTDILCDFSLSGSDKAIALPVAPNTIQRKLVRFFNVEADVNDKYALCKKIYEEYPDLYFSKWKIKKLDERVENVKVYAEIVPGKDPEKEMVKDVSNDYILQILPNKKAKVKVKMSFDPSPTEMPDIQRYQIQLVNQDGYVVLGDLKNAKLNLRYNAKTVTINIKYGDYEDGIYFFRVHALDADGMELDKDNPFKPDSIQAHWEKENEDNPDLSKEQFQMENNVLMINETTFFSLQNVKEEIDAPEVPVDKRSSFDTMLQAYFDFRIIGLKKKLEKGLTLPEVSDGSEWRHGSLNDVFAFDFGNAAFAYQIQNSKKLLEIERGFYNHATQLGNIYAEISGNPTDDKLQDWVYNPLSVVSAPAELIQLRMEVFNLIQGCAASQSGVLAIFPLYKYADTVKKYIETYSAWIRSQIELSPSAETIVELQNIDMVSLQVEMPDGSHTLVKLISPVHPLRLAWMVNIYDLYQDWEYRTIQDPFTYQKQWNKNLDALFLGDLKMETSPIVITDGPLKVYQYIGELTFGWGIYALPTKYANDTFASEFRQLKSYVASLLNIPRPKQIDSDVNLDLVLRHIDNYIKSHKYTDKVVINLFNAGDANVFADALVAMERRGKAFEYEIRLFADDKLIQPGDALKELLDPDSLQSEAAETFSLASRNRLFPKLRFSINSIGDFITNHQNYQAHISFLVNPFPVSTELIRPDQHCRSFYLNGIIDKSFVQYILKGKSTMWSKFISGNPMPTQVTEFANETVRMFADIQFLIGRTLSSSATESVPATCLTLNEADSMLLSFIHDVSDWVVTFDKNMGPEFYDLPCGDNGESPYLLDYVPGQERAGVSSFLTTRPTSEVEGLMIPHFQKFGIDVGDPAKFKDLLEDVRTVSSSILMQTNSTQNKAFEVLGITFTQRLLKKKHILTDSFIIPVDLHKELFEDLDSQDKERADDLVVSIDRKTRQMTFTVIEIKCRKSLSSDEEEDLCRKIVSQIDNTIFALKEHFSLENDLLDRELKTIELANLLSFYIRRSCRYNVLSPEVAQDYLTFLDTLHDGYSINFKKIGIVYNFDQVKKQRKEPFGDTLIYLMGFPVINDILSDDKSLETYSLDEDDRDFIGNFGTERAMDINNKISRAVNSSNSKEQVYLTKEHDKKQSLLQDEGDNDSKNDIVVEKDSVVFKTDNHIGISRTERKDIHNKENSDDIAIDNEPKNLGQVAVDVEPISDYQEPDYDILIGDTEETGQFGILGKTVAGGKSIAVDLDGCNTFSLFGVQGAGKSYTIGTVAEMTLRQFSNVNKLQAPLASVIFHYSDTMDYAPEFTSIIYPNDDASQLAKLKQVYGAEPGSIKDVILLTTESKVEERQDEYPNLEVHNIGFDSSELQVKDWLFLLGAVGNDSVYIHEFKQILKKLGKDMSLQNIKRGVITNQYLSKSQKDLAIQRISFAEEYIVDGCKLQQYLKPGRLIIVDLRDEYIEKNEALGLFVVMLNIFSGVKTVDDKDFNKFIVFDEAHKYMDDPKLVESICTAIREMRHKGVSIMIASQNPIGLPDEIIALSSIILLHRFNSPKWVRHIQSSITAMSALSASEMSALGPGEAYLWANKATDRTISARPVKISIRPRVTKHGGDTISAVKE